SIWEIVSEGSGIATHLTNQDPNILNINGLIIDGKLSFSITSKLDQISTGKLITLFLSKLKIIITHCVNKRTSDYTISDFNDFIPYVMFNSINAKKNDSKLFIFPPANGGAESYFNNIVSKLPDNHLILFNNFYLYLKDKFGDPYITSISYEKLVKDYIYYLRLIQPGGSYNLCGWSFGGLLAFEAARQLSNLGYNVANIILIDPYFHYRRAVSETNSKVYKIDSINYKYLPVSNLMLANTNIVLFKALKSSDSNFIVRSQNDLWVQNASKVNKYYVDKTKFNHLDDLLDCTSFKTVYMASTHDSWVKNDDQIIEICNVLKSL
ncbi:MAG: hypothetical protein J0M23_06835, partial [Rickettsiales bacterium]|nr:hypothetical protein [Rickettsiales bacterium]